MLAGFSLSYLLQSRILRLAIHAIILILALLPDTLSQQQETNQDTFKMSSSIGRYVYTLSENGKTDASDSSVVKLTLTNNFATEDRSIFLCFFTSLREYESFTEGVFPPSNDMESCFLQEATQILFIQYPSASNRLFVYSVFLDSTMKVATYPYDVETFVLVEFISNSEACQISCDIQCQTSEKGEQSQAELANEQKQSSNCPACQGTRTGTTCSHDLTILKANDFVQRTHRVELKPRQWNFFGYKITNQTIDKLRNSKAYEEEQDAEDAINYIFYLKMQTQRQKGFELDMYVSHISEMEGEGLGRLSLPDFRSANKVGPAFFFEQKMKCEGSSNESSFQPQILIIGVFNLDSTTKEAQMYLMNTQIHSEVEPEMQEISLTDAFILLGILFCLMLILGMYCLVVALLRKSDREQREEQRLKATPNLQILSQQQIDQYMSKYPYVHILKAVSKRQSKVMGDITSETHQEGARRISVKCGSILGKNECAICLAAFELADICRLTICDHVFHAQCIDSWLSKNSNCPFCRFEMNQGTLSSWIKHKQISGYYPLDEELDSIPTEEVVKEEKSQERKDVKLESNGIEIHEKEGKPQISHQKNEYFKFSEDSSFQSDAIPSGKEPNDKEIIVLQKISAQPCKKLTQEDQKQSSQKNLSIDQQQNIKDNPDNGKEIALQLKGLTSNDNEGTILSSSTKKHSENSTFQGITPIHSYQDNSEVFSGLVENQEKFIRSDDPTAEAARQGRVKYKNNMELSDKKKNIGLHKKYESKEALLKIPLEFIEEYENKNNIKHDNNMKNDPQEVNLLGQDVIISMATNESPVKTNLQSHHALTGFQINKM